MVEKYIRQSLNDLQLSYLDMYLIHTPFAIPEANKDLTLHDANGNVLIDTNTDHLAVWKVIFIFINIKKTFLNFVCLRKWKKWLNSA